MSKRSIDNQGSAKGNAPQAPAKVTIKRDYVTEKHSGRVEDSGSMHGIKTSSKTNFK